MEFVLRCNDLKCRSPLHDQAVVTTCSHIFCTPCADSTGLSRASNGERQCPACNTQLIHPDDVVVAGLNPTEDYKTSVLSGLSPTVITECAGRGLGFYSYQVTQEVIYQESLAKNLTDKYAGLNQQMDQLVVTANTQIKALTDKMQNMQADQATLEAKNHELVDAFREKSRAQAQLQKLYQSLKAQVMASHVADAAGHEADFALQTARGDRFVDKLPGTRQGRANYSQFGGGNQQQGRRGQHNRDGSGSSGNSGGQQRGGGFGLGPSWNSQSQSQGLGNRGYTGQSAPVGTPSQYQPRSRLPVLGSTRANTYLAANMGPPYQASPSMARQPLGAGSGNLGGFGFGTKPLKRNSGGTGNGPLGR